MKPSLLTCLAPPRLVFHFAVIFVAASAAARVEVPGLFSDHVVLQRAEDVPVWGTADPGEMVSVHFAGQSASAVTNDRGRWSVSLDLARAATGPSEMTIEGTNKILVRDVVVGEAWLASGQSNMDYKLRLSIGAEEEIPRSANPMLRLFKMPRQPSRDPLTSLDGRWVVAEPETTAQFSGVGYYFGKTLQQTLDVPVGIIDPSIGGSPVEGWISPEGIAADPVLRAGRDRLLAELDSYPGRLKQFRHDFIQWQEQWKREDRRKGEPESFAAPSVDTRDWKRITLPAAFAEVGLPEGGAVWLRRNVEVSPGMAGRELRLDLGSHAGFLEVYWNGEKVGETTVEGYPGFETKWTYRIPPRLAREGISVLAVRTFNPAGGAFLRANEGSGNFRLILDGNNRVFLAGEWLAKVEHEFPKLPGSAPRAPVEPNLPPEMRGLASGLFNGQMNPLLGYALRGFIWYQGEGNVERAFQYRTTFARLIEDWRRIWRRPEMPFYFCQLPNYGPYRDTPGESNWAELRESQEAALSLPATGMAVLIDVGEEADLHPRDKKNPGIRLANIALAKSYGRPVAWAAPSFARVERDGAALRIHFNHAEGGLVARRLPETYQPRTNETATRPLPRNSPASELEGFALCGVDGKWSWADAKIEGESVVVRSKDVPAPTAVRYAWADNPICNLYNKAGLPAAPFRTDRQPPSTRNNSY